MPPAIAQFSHTLDKNTTTQFFRLADKYAGESKQEKKARIEDKAKALAEGKKVDETKKPFFVKSGLNVSRCSSSWCAHLCSLCPAARHGSRRGQEGLACRDRRRC